MNAFNLIHRWDAIVKAKYLSRKPAPGGGWVYTYPKPNTDKHAGAKEDTKPVQKPASYKLTPGGLPEGETWKLHFSGHPDGGGRPSAARAAVHAQIVKTALGSSPVAPKDRPTLVLMQGGSGVGKSSILKHMGIAEGAVVVNNDDVKVLIPEYKRFLDDPTGVVPTNAASDVHVESSFVMKQIREAAIKDRRDIIYDSNLNNVSIARNMIDRFKKLGYRIHLITVHADSKTALERVADRHVRTGRGVPEWAVKQSLREMPAAFRGIRDLVDDYDLFTTTASPKTVVDPETGEVSVSTRRHIATARTDPETGTRTEEILHPTIHAKVIGA